MFSFLLLIVYLVFISLGLPDGVLGAAWPSIFPNLNVPVSYMGIITIIVTSCTILSSLSTSKLINKLGMGKLVLFSVILTAIGLFGFSISNSFWMICLFAFPYGFGAGSVDASINNYAASNYSSKHMSWLHCMWGVGASMGPVIMGFILSNNFIWNIGYLVLGIIQSVLIIVLFFTLKLWKTPSSNIDDEKMVNLTIKESIKVKGVVSLFVCFFCYCALEQTLFMWSGSYLSMHLGLNEDIAASFSSMALIGLTIGRLISGFISNKLNDKQMIRLGSFLIIIGIVLLLLDINSTFSIIGLAFVGLGCAPIYPCIIHSIPLYFGKEKSQSIVSLQISIAYLGILFIPSLFGILVDYIGVYLLPIYLFIFFVIMIIMHEIQLIRLKK